MNCPNTRPGRDVWRLAAASAGLAAILVVIWVARVPILSALGGWLDVGVAPRGADYLLILNGERNTRPFSAARIFQRYDISQVLVTSHKTRHHSQPKWPAEHEIVGEVLTRRGVPAERIQVIDAKCTSTLDEARVLADFLTSHPGASILVVTNDFHTRRTRWIVRHILGPRAARVSVVSAPCIGFDKSNWWRNEDGFVWYLSEFGKLGYYWFRHGSGFWWCVACGLTGTWLTVRWRARSSTWSRGNAEP